MGATPPQPELPDARPDGAAVTPAELPDWFVVEDAAVTPAELPDWFVVEDAAVTPAELPDWIVVEGAFDSSDSSAFDDFDDDPGANQLAPNNTNADSDPGSQHPDLSGNGRAQSDDAVSDYAGIFDEPSDGAHMPDLKGEMLDIEEFVTDDEVVEEFDPDQVPGRRDADVDSEQRDPHRKSEVSSAKEPPLSGEPNGSSSDSEGRRPWQPDGASDPELRRFMDDEAYADYGSDFEGDDDSDSFGESERQGDGERNSHRRSEESDLGSDSERDSHGKSEVSDGSSEEESLQRRVRGADEVSENRGSGSPPSEPPPQQRAAEAAERRAAPAEELPAAPPEEQRERSGSPDSSRPPVDDDLGRQRRLTETANPSPWAKGPAVAERSEIISVDVASSSASSSVGPPAVSGGDQIRVADPVVDGRVERRVLSPGEKAGILGALVVFGVVSAGIVVWQVLSGLGGGDESAKMRLGAKGVDQAARGRSAASAGSTNWQGRAARSYDDQQMTLTDLQQLLADTDKTVATLLDTHGEQLEVTRNTLDAADLTIMACTPMAESLLAVPGVGPALSLKFQLAIAMPLVAGCNTAAHNAQHSSTHTATAINNATTTYDYIHTTATQLT